MTNYIIEGNVNFFEELMKHDSDEDTQIKDHSNSKNVCLISNQPLDKTEIKLDCNHSFNYLSLYNEICTNQKGWNHNSYATDTVGHYQIKCPYCRNINNYLLPQSLDIENVKNKRYVNLPKTHSMIVKCEFNSNKGNCSQCESLSYITPHGRFCKLHYKKIKSLNDLSNKSTAPKTKTIKSVINIPNKHINSETIEQMKTFGKNHTIAHMKSILKMNNLKVSGVKQELISRIFENNLQTISKTH